MRTQQRHTTVYEEGGVTLTSTITTVIWRRGPMKVSRVEQTDHTFRYEVSKTELSAPWSHQWLLLDEEDWAQLKVLLASMDDPS